jgi:Flp pilus assembly protein TadD
MMIVAIAIPGAASARKASGTSDVQLLAVFGVPADSKAADSESAAVTSVVQQIAATGRFRMMTFSTALPVVARSIAEKRLPMDTEAKVADPNFAIQVAQLMGASYALCIVRSVTPVPSSDPGTPSGMKVVVKLTLIKSGGKRWASEADSTIPHKVGTKDEASVAFASSSAATTAVSALMARAFGSVAPVIPTSVSPLEAVTTVTMPERNIDSEYEQSMKDVERYISDKDSANAVVELKKAISLKPTKSQPRIELLNLYTKLGMTASARDECKRALLFDRDNLVLHQILAKMSISAGMLVDAEAQCREMIRLDPKNAEAYVTLGDLCWNQAKPDDAESAYKEAAVLDPASPSPHDKLHKLDLARKKYSVAMDELLQYKLLSTGSDASARDLAVARAVEDEFNQIIGKLNAADDDYRHGITAKDDYYQESKDLETRLDAFDKFVSTQVVPDSMKDAYSHAEYAVSLIEQANSSAISYLQTQKKSDSDQAALYRNEARTEFALYTHTIPQTANSK